MPTFSKAQKEQYKEKKQREQAELLERAVDSLLTQEGWQRFLNTRAAFHKYSFNNIILVAIQRPDATQIMGKGGKDGKTGWKSLGRTIIEGEKSIKILAPMPVYEKDAKGAPVKDGQGNKVLRFVWFKTVDVYDVAQTEGDDLPERPENPEYAVQGDAAEEYLYRLVQFAKGYGCTVEFIAMDELAAARSGMAIRVNKSQPINAQVHALTGELVSYLSIDVSADYNANERKIMDASATYLACRQMGVDTSGVTIPHLLTLAEQDPKKRLKAMKEFATQIDTLSNTILEGVRL